jgi:hypothetical protein
MNHLLKACRKPSIERTGTARGRVLAQPEYW